MGEDCLREVQILHFLPTCNYRQAGKSREPQFGSPGRKGKSKVAVKTIPPAESLPFDRPGGESPENWHSHHLNMPLTHFTSFSCTFLNAYFLFQMVKWTFPLS